MQSLGIDGKDSADHGTSSSSKLGLRSARAKLLRRTALIIVDEALILQRKIFDMVDVVLKDLLCSSQEDFRPSFGGLSMVFP